MLRRGVHPTKVRFFTDSTIGNRLFSPPFWENGFFVTFSNHLNFRKAFRRVERPSSNGGTNRSYRSQLPFPPVDSTEELPGTPGDTVMQGLDSLAQRCKEYKAPLNAEVKRELEVFYSWTKINQLPSFLGVLYIPGGC